MAIKLGSTLEQILAALPESEVDTRNYVTITDDQDITGDKSFEGNVSFNGDVDLTGANVLGLELGGSGTSGLSITEVPYLPTADINTNTIYRVPYASYYYGKHIENDNLADITSTASFMRCEVVSELPTTGGTSVFFDNNTIQGVSSYYNMQDKQNWAYVDSSVSNKFSQLTGTTIPVGWYLASDLFAAAGETYVGITNDMSDVQNDEKYRLYVQHIDYIYNGKWYPLNDYVIFIDGDSGNSPRENIYRFLAHPDKILVKGAVNGINMQARFVRKQRDDEDTTDVYVFSSKVGNIDSDQPDSTIYVKFYKAYRVEGHYEVEIVPDASNNAGNSLNIIELQGQLDENNLPVESTGTLTDEQFQLLQNDYYNTLVKMVFPIESEAANAIFILSPILELAIPSVGSAFWGFGLACAIDGELLSVLLEIQADKSWTFNFEINELGGEGGGDGLTQEEVQSMIDTSINGALEGDY